ncbi:MAG: FAD-dependent oxidoreductase [Candidatus Omnitrophica bacterium]|nr:FAD-dependent oxidoreductase [Candidatus Omnitrophota bacterium]
MVEFETRVIDVIERTNTVKSFRFGEKPGEGFKPGQFFTLTIKVGNEDKAKHFSFSNSPTETGYIEFTKRITESEFSKALDKLKTGDIAKIKMPLGKFTFEGECEKIAFLSGGIGITPIRSMCKFVIDKKLKTDIVLLYSNRTEDNIIFEKDFEDMAGRGNLRVVHTLTSPDIDKKIWKGRTGYITDAMIKEEIPDYKERIFYICGPPNMVGAMVSVLKDKLALGNDKIRIENFAGY